MTVDLEEFVAGYVDAMLWTTSIEQYTADRLNRKNETDYAEDTSALDAGFTRADVAKSGGMENVHAACENFCRANATDLEYYCAERSYDPSQGSVSSYAGHDFWLTRNGHGAGFWDRGLGALGNRLTAAAGAFGEAYAYVGDDDLIYVS